MSAQDDAPPIEAVAALVAAANEDRERGSAAWAEALAETMTVITVERDAEFAARRQRVFGPTDELTRHIHDYCNAASGTRAAA